MKFSLSVLSFLCCLFVPRGYSQVPNKISYQGFLTTLAGAPVADGVANFQFDLFDSLSGGTSLWSEIQIGDSIRHGSFSVVLGSVTPLNLPFSRALFLQVKATSGPAGPAYPLTFSPRTELLSSPYAFRAKIADSLSGGVAGAFLPVAGGQMTGPITNTGDPAITMGKGNFGTGNINTGLQAFVAGANNRASGDYSVVGGGGDSAAVDSNSASGGWSTVGGGIRNTASGLQAVVSGGTSNTASALDAVVGGGVLSTASAYSATVAGGSVNTASGIGATVSGGHLNAASGGEATVGGGTVNKASHIDATVSGGNTNTASGFQSTVGGGSLNIASSVAATVGGGNSNTAGNFYATVGGGSANAANGNYSTVPGGSANRAAGSFSLAAGQQANANHNGTFVWADSENTDFASTGDNQFLIRAAGGVGIGTASPGAALDVNGATKLGSGAPAIMMKKLTGTTAISDGGTVSIAHGLDASKILSIDVMVEWTASSYIPPRYPVSGYEFFWGSGGANINITNTPGNSGSILSKPIKILVTYEQ
jgi:hypothetical protein